MFAKLLALLALASLAATQEQQEVDVENLIRTGYIHAPGLGYYRLVPGTPEPWAEARRKCEEEGAQLFVVNSMREANFLREMVYGNSTQFGFVNVNVSEVRIVHTGFHDLFIEGEYLTVRSEPLIMTGFVHWQEGHPIGDQFNNCGAYDLEGYILDNRCHERLPWICEIPEYDARKCNC